jgi:hypothetical protein
VLLLDQLVFCNIEGDFNMTTEFDLNAAREPGAVELSDAELNDVSGGKWVAVCYSCPDPLSGMSACGEVWID